MNNNNSIFLKNRYYELLEELLDIAKRIPNEDSINKFKEILINNTNKELIYVSKSPKTKFTKFITILMTITSILFLYSTLIVVFSAIFNNVYLKLSIVLLFICLIIVTYNGYIIINNTLFTKSIKIYKKYSDSLEYKHIVSLDFISKKINLDYSILLNNIKWAIKEGLLPQGHLVLDNHFLILSDDIFQFYSENKTILNDNSLSLTENLNKSYNNTEIKANDLYKDILICEKKIKNKIMLENINQIKYLSSIITNDFYLELLPVLINFYEINQILLRNYINFKQSYFKSNVNEKKANDLVEIEKLFLVFFDNFLRIAYKNIAHDLLTEKNEEDIDDDNYDDEVDCNENKPKCTEITLTETQRRNLILKDPVYEFIISNPRTTSKAIAEHCNLSYQRLTPIISKLLVEGVISFETVKKIKYFYVVDEMHIRNEEAEKDNESDCAENK